MTYPRKYPNTGKGQLHRGLFMTEIRTSEPHDLKAGHDL